MGGKRGVCWPFPVVFVILAVVMIAGCICGLNSAAPQAIDKGDPNVSSPGLATQRSISPTEPLALDAPGPSMVPAPTPLPSAFTVYAEGGKDHRPGETLRLYGTDTYSDAVYLYLSCTKAPICGGRLDDLQKPVVDLDNTTFTRVNVSQDCSWEYDWTVPSGQPALMFELYNVIAASEPRDKPHLDEALAWDMVAVKIS